MEGKANLNYKKDNPHYTTQQAGQGSYASMNDAERVFNIVGIYNAILVYFKVDVTPSAPAITSQK